MNLGEVRKALNKGALYDFSREPRAISWRIPSNNPTIPPKWCVLMGWGTHFLINGSDVVMMVIITMN